MSAEMEKFMSSYAMFRKRKEEGSMIMDFGMEDMELYVISYGLSLDLSSANDEIEVPSYTNINTSSSSLKRHRSDDQKSINSSSSSIKRHRSDDQTSICAFKMFKYVEFLYSMYCGRRRVQRLVSKGVPELDRELKELVAHFDDFLVSVEKAQEVAAEVEKRRLVGLAKQILLDWELIDNKIERLNLFGVSPLQTPIIYYRCAVPSAWLLEDDWRDKAYQEVLSLKNKHSCLLDQAYVDHYKLHVQRGNVSASEVLLHKKRINLLGYTIEDIGFLSKGRCYKWVMGIKQFLILRENASDQPSIYGNIRRCEQGLDLLAPTDVLTQQQRNWRDEIYDEIRSIRNMYSEELDKAFREITRMDAPEVGEEYNACCNFISDSLQFLAISRAGLVFLSEDYCRAWLDYIKSFLENAEDSVPAKQYMKLLGKGHSSSWKWLASSQMNWRDLAYQQLLDKADRFVYQEYSVYLANKGKWSKMKIFDESFKKLEVKIQAVVSFYTMPRCEMSLMESMDEYFQMVDRMIVCLLDSMYLMQSFSSEVRDWSPTVLIPKRKRLLLQ